MRDVALRAKVSPSTVSNFLNDRLDRMRPGTRRRVERAIQELQFQPNHVARHLRSGKPLFVGLVVPSVANPFWGALARHVESAALAAGYQVLLCNGGRDPEREALYVSGLWAEGVREVILGSSLPTLDHLRDLIDRGLRVIVFDRPPQPADPDSVISVSVDNVLGAGLATRHLLKLGHRRIAFVSGPIRTLSRVERRRGHERAIEEAGLPADALQVWQGASRKDPGDAEGAELGRRGALALLRGRTPPTAIVTVNDIYALGVCGGVRELGLRVPEDVSVVGFDDIVIAGLLVPPLTTIRQPLQEMARTALEVIRAGASQEPIAKMVRARPRLIVRGSTAPPPGANQSASNAAEGDEERCSACCSPSCSRDEASRRSGGRRPSLDSTVSIS